MLQKSYQETLTNLSHLKSAAIHASNEKKRIGSGIPKIDASLSGGLPLGSLIEWGAPYGQCGRELLIPWLREAILSSQNSSSSIWVLWVYDSPQLIPYAPAWSARGIDLSRIRFACTSNPLTDLRPVFMEPLFRLIILDVAHKFSPEEYAFVTRQARSHDQVIILVRNHLLKTDEGNIWARIRLNTWFEPKNLSHHVEILKGSSTHHLDIQLP